MAGFMKRTMSYLGMSDVVPEDEDDEVIDEEP
ncbi:MAG TPA: cell division protein SepF, partial [Bifidobacterium animalis]|nr:cell division protein SepF [Bifidobacterium animalis]